MQYSRVNYTKTSAMASPFEEDTGQRTDTQKDEEVIEFPGKECRMVLMGRTGNGKSSTGNTIVGVECFSVANGISSACTRCQWHKTMRFGIQIEVVDTPGFFDPHVDHVTVRKEIMRCVGMLSPGPHALLMVVRLDVRFTNEQAKSVQEVLSLFGDTIIRHVIIIFTHGEDLDSDISEAKALQRCLNGCPKSLTHLMQDADNRYVVFYNRGSKAVKDRQVRQLILTIKEMISTTGDMPYNSSFLQRCESAVMKSTTQLGQLLDSTTVTNEHRRRLIRDGLEGRDMIETVLREVLEEHDRDMRQMMKERRHLKEELEKSQKLQTELKENLRMEQNKWGCDIL